MHDLSNTVKMFDILDAHALTDGPWLISLVKHMKTNFLLMARYDGLAVIPLEWVQRDYFRHLKVEKLLRKIQAGEIALPLVRMEGRRSVPRAYISPTWQTTSTSKP